MKFFVIAAFDAFKKKLIHESGKIPQSELSNIEASFLHCVKKEGNRTEFYYDVTGAFIPFRPFQESFKRNLFSSTEMHVKRFIPRGIVSIISEYGDSGSNPEERRITMNDLNELVGNSKSLPKFSGRYVMRL